MQRPAAPRLSGAVHFASFLVPVLIALALPSSLSSRPKEDFRLNTWSLAALDPATGAVGVAGASCVPRKPVDAIAALVPGKGVAVVQGLWSVDLRNRVLEWLIEGLSAEEILKRAGNLPDSDLKARQFGVVTLRGDRIETGGFTGSETLDWSGHRQDRIHAVSVQGNVLEGEAVVANALAAFNRTETEGMNGLADRLMRGLEAGSAAGGDKRCNVADSRQSAASAFILLARGQGRPYAAKDIGVTDTGLSTAPYLAISVASDLGGSNPVTELRKRYDSWRSGSEPKLSGPKGGEIGASGR